MGKAVSVTTSWAAKDAVGGLKEQDKHMIEKDLADGGIIMANAANKIYPRLLYLYHLTKAPVPLAMVQGKFY